MGEAEAGKRDRRRSLGKIDYENGINSIKSRNSRKVRVKTLAFMFNKIDKYTYLV